MTHNFRTGTWKKTKQTGRDHAHFLMNSTNAQRAFIHEVTSQMLGQQPSNFWGHPVPHEFMVPTDKNTLSFVRNASKHSAHEFGRLLASHKKGSGWASELGSVIGTFGKTAAKYGVQGGKWMIAHGDEIKTGIGIAKGLLQTGTTIAQLTGHLSSDNKSTLDAIANAINQHAQSDVYKSKKTSKTGGRIRV